MRKRGAAVRTCGNINCRSKSVWDIITCGSGTLKGPIRGKDVQLESGLVSEVKTKTYNIHAQEQNDIRGQQNRKKKTYVGIAWVNVKFA